eukprot:TRINITY_DN27706_c0_g1_i1.p1 TRINITY_DN27706_c0_g1~~TRINITY_DN27706_c0_g1_i1.p1  ORF type:complete len:421 (+),score=-22.90 TRINITY_DN27706_c0_g1_i1:163-1425(+)
MLGFLLSLGILSLICDPGTAEGSNATVRTGPPAIWLHDISRNAIDGSGSGNSLFVAQYDAYFSALLSMAVVTLVFAGISALSGAAFAFLRFRSNTCGGKDRRLRYSNRSRVLIRTFMFFNSVLLVVLLAVGLAANQGVHPALQSFSDRTRTQAQAQSVILRSIQPALQQLDSRTETQRYVDVLTRNGQEVVDAAGTTTRYVPWETYRLIVLAISYFVVLVILVLGCYVSIWRNAKASFVFGMMCFGGIMCLWVNFTFSFPFSIVAADFCYDMEVETISSRLYRRYVSRGAEYQGLSQVCPCSSFANTNATIGWTEGVLAARQTLLQSMTPADPRYQQTKQDISTLNDLLDALHWLLECRWLLDVFNSDFEGQVCGPYLNGFVTLWAVAFTMIGILFIDIFLGIVGYKRLKPDLDSDTRII